MSDYLDKIALPFIEAHLAYERRKAMQDPTERPRRAMVHEINAQVESQDKDEERTRLEAEYGPVWTTEELAQEFTIIGFQAPFVVVEEKATGQKGTLVFQHMPRLYYGWQPDTR